MNSYIKCIQVAIQNGLLEKKQITMIDVGCNIEKIPGESRPTLDDFTECFIQIVGNTGNEIKVVGYEPVHYQDYAKKYENNPNVELIKAALTDKEGKTIFFIPGPAHGLSSTVERPVFYDIERKGHELKRVVVPTKKLDIDFNGRSIDYLKIDTEGAELMVLKGAEQLMKSGLVRFIQLEHGGTYQDAGYTIEDVRSFLSNQNYVEIHTNSTEMLWKLNE